MKTKFIRWFKKGVGVSLAFAVAFSASLYFGGQTVYASTKYTDTEPNDSHEQAQGIARNAQTAAQYVSNQSGVYRYVTGTLSDNDEDWYRVTLYTYEYTENRTYLDLNVGTGTIVVELYSSSNFDEPIQEFQFQKYGDTNVYEVSVPENGVYYLRVYHTTTRFDTTYSFTIGNPQYSLGTYTYKFAPTTLAAKATWEQPADLTEMADIPKGAIGYEISIGGCSSSVSSKRYFYNKFYDAWVATSTLYKYDLPVSDVSKVAQLWKAKIVSTSSSSATFTPTMTINYVAPDLP